MPVSSMQMTVGKRLKSFIQQCLKETSKERSFKSINDIYSARKIATPSMPLEAIHKVMTRQSQKLEDGSWKLLSDPLLNAPSPMMFSDKEILELVKAITCEVVFFRADDPLYESYRIQSEPYLNLIQNLKMIVISGSHYIHFESPQKIASSIF